MIITQMIIYTPDILVIEAFEFVSCFVFRISSLSDKWEGHDMNATHRHLNGKIRR